ncbi:MAG TPA: helix-turn-helix transcriptional regulator [Candidatus Polarisedimenticolaceae bacterium]|nr:helix-turn-helix transcriptional regulator [Candidatus Polarisedimenticolaceae bacterium]
MESIDASKPTGHAFARSLSFKAHRRGCLHSQASLARLCGLSQSRISRIELRLLPATADEQATIAAALGLPIMALFEEPQPAADRELAEAAR